MASYGLIVLGILIIIGNFYFTNVWIFPEIRTLVEEEYPKCNFTESGIPMGSDGLSMNEDGERVCKGAKTLNDFLYWDWLLYLHGLGLVVLGLGVRHSKNSNKEIIREVVVIKEAKKDPEVEKKPKSKK
jgi:hypothetical protein